MREVNFVSPLIEDGLESLMPPLLCYVVGGKFFHDKANLSVELSHAGSHPKLCSDLAFSKELTFLLRTRT